MTGALAVGSLSSMSAKKSAPEQSPALKFSMVNLWFALAGMGTIVLGYYLLGQGSITAAPLLLVLGYVLLLPLAIIL